MSAGLGLIISALLGLILGSFTSMASYRLPRGESLIKGRSHCPLCSHVLGVRDLIPIFSWLWGKGKCRYCHQAISPAYLLHEVMLGIVFPLIFWVYGMTILTPVLWGVATCLMIVIAVDFTHYYLPDAIQIPLAMLGVLYGMLVYTEPLEPLCGALLFAAMGFGLRFLGYAFKKGEALGWGDIKFFAIAGLFLGLDPVKATAFLLCSGIIGIFTALLWKHLSKGHIFPFAPALAIALLSVVLFSGYNNY